MEIIMHRYRTAIYVPVLLDQIIIAPVLLLRRIWYGYTFRRIPLVNSKTYAIVDAADYYRLSKYTWWVHRRKKLCKALRLTQEGGLQYPIYMHREILRPEKGKVVDHINRDGLDNRRSNLRAATSLQNNMNRPSKKGTSEYKGVFFKSQAKRWKARISVDGKRMHLGFFEDEIEAARAYDAAAKKYYGEFAYLNFPAKRKQKGLRNKIKAILSSKFNV